MSVLDAHGVDLADNVRLEFERALIKGQAGDTRAQCQCPMCVWIVYLGQPPSEDDVTRWERELSLLTADDDGGGRRVIELQRYESYSKLHKNTRTETLERDQALRRLESLPALYL